MEIWNTIKNFADKFKDLVKNNPKWAITISLITGALAALGIYMYNSNPEKPSSLSPDHQNDEISLMNKRSTGGVHIKNFWLNNGFLKLKSGNDWVDVDQAAGGRMTRKEFIDQAHAQLNQKVPFKECILENSHCFIQTLFPTMTKSGAQPSTPYLDHATFQELNNTPDKAKIMTEHVEVYSKFLGNYQKDIFKPGNHNEKRITRVLESLRIFGLQDLRNTFYQKVTTMATKNGCPINKYWQEEMQVPIIASGQSLSS